MLISDKNTLHICYAVDDNFVDMCCASIYSIIRRKDPDTKIQFYILGDKITKGNQFGVFKNIDNIDAIVVSGDAKQIIDPRIVVKRTGYATYLRMIIPKLKIFSNVEKVLYIDSDIFAIRDIYNLYHYSLDGYSIGMVKDAVEVVRSTTCDYPWPEYEHHDWFCNAGLILMDLDKLRMYNYADKWIQEARMIQDDLHNDQTIINKVNHYDCKLLPPTFQIPYHNFVRFPHSLTMSIHMWNRVYGTRYRSLDELVRSCYFWHFYEDKQQLSAQFPFIKYLLDYFMSDAKEFMQTKHVKPWKPEDDVSIYIDFSKY